MLEAVISPSPMRLARNLVKQHGPVVLTNRVVKREDVKKEVIRAARWGHRSSINGTGLMQTTKVAFNGTFARFAINSDILITATVPAAATTGKIKLVTQGGSTTTATSFTVN